MTDDYSKQLVLLQELIDDHPTIRSVLDMTVENMLQLVDDGISVQATMHLASLEKEKKHREIKRWLGMSVSDMIGAEKVICTCPRAKGEA